ncbi:MAG: hypothetical protein R3B96_09555 [Pirellulaceae bacterium]
MLVLGVVVSMAAAQESLPTPSRTTGTAIAPRTNLILNESSPSDWLSSEGINNPRSRQQADSQPITRLPVSASVSLDDEQHMERYQPRVRRASLEHATSSTRA